MRSNRRSGWLTYLTLSFLTMAAAATAASALQETAAPSKIRKLGGRTTAISIEPARTREDFQRLVKKYERDLRAAFATGGWQGDPGDFFSAVEEGRFERVSLPVGGRWEWMAFRRGSSMTVRNNVEWAGRAPVDAWQVEVVHDGMRAAFVAPFVCLNLTLLEETPDLAAAPEPPKCSVSGRAECSSKSIALTATSEAPVEISSIALDRRELGTSNLRSEGSGRWRLPWAGNGSYRITATATRDGLSGSCSATVSVDCPVPVCRLAASYDPATKLVSVRSAGSVGEVTLTGLTLPDGSAGDLGRVQAQTVGEWSFNPRKSLPRREGSYTYTFAASAELDGEQATCAPATVSIPVARRDDRWTLRGFFGGVDADGEHIETSTVRPGGVVERTRLDLGDGTAFGLSLEYRATELIGLELSAIFGQLDTGLVVDLDNEWERDTEDVSFTPLLFGVNFHLSPNAPVDFYIGPTLGVVSYGDARFNALGESFRRDFDSDFGFGLNLGLDVPFGDSAWLFNAGLRYLDTDSEEETLGLDIPVDPILVTVGLGVRF